MNKFLGFWDYFNLNFTVPSPKFKFFSCLSTRGCSQRFGFGIFWDKFNKKLMPLPPQKFREAVFQILYSADFGSESEEMIPFMMEELKTTRRAMVEAKIRAQQALAKQLEIDEVITSASTEYSFDRISRVEKTILRLGFFELLFDEALPPKIVIAEAIRLCRKFGTPESAQFVNAILDGVYKKNATPVSEQPQFV